MKKNQIRILCILLALLMLCAILLAALPISADAAGGPVDDGAGLLTADEIASLEKQIDGVVSETGYDILIVTTDSLGGKDVVAYADDYYDNSGDGDRDGILFLISMEDRDWAFSTGGKAIARFSDSDLYTMEKRIIPFLSSGDYAGAFERFVEMTTDILLDTEKSDAPLYSRDPYESDVYFEGETGKTKKTLMDLLYFVPVAALIAFVVLTVMKKQMKTAVKQKYAASYITSFDLRKELDIFLYANVTKTRKAEQNHGGGSSGGGRSSGSSFHTSSGGHSHGGSHGKF